MNADAGFSRRTFSDNAGAYLMALLPPGHYNLSVEAPGFRRLVQSGNTLEVNQRARVDVTLQVGQVNETEESTPRRHHSRANPLLWAALWERS